MNHARASAFSISHAKFSVAFPFLLYASCNALNIDRIAKWFHGRDGLDAWGLAAYLLVGLCLFVAFFVLFAHRRTVKPLAIVLLVVSGAATYFIAKYDVAVDTSMIRNALHTDPTEVGQLLSTQMIPYAAGLILLPTLLILSLEITFDGRARYLLDSLRIASVALLVGVGTAYLQYDAIHRAGNISNKYIVYSLVPVNAIAGTIGVVSKAVRPLLRSARPTVHVAGRVATKGDLVVVLAIGESSRRKSFSVYGYHRVDTTPTLERLSGLAFLNGVSRIGTTLYALPEILEKEGAKLPAVVAGVGIQTSCYVNYTLYDNCAAVGETPVSRCGHGGACYDEDVVTLLDDALRQYTSGYRFIVLHLGGGSHGPRYADRYPPEFRRFTPACSDADVVDRCTPEELYNAYDNSILYVDHVLGQAIEGLDRAHVPYVFMYLSDHGESLLEGDRLFHGMPPGVRLPPEQAEIPLIVKSSVPISIVPRAQYRQPDVFDTVLDLFSIETPLFDRSGSFIRRPAARS